MDKKKKARKSKKKKGKGSRKGATGMVAYSRRARPRVSHIPRAGPRRGGTHKPNGAFRRRIRPRGSNIPRAGLHRGRNTWASIGLYIRGDKEKRRKKGTVRKKKKSK